jgi:hypothetical protein
MVLFFGQCRGLVNSRKGSRRKGLFARPAPHVTAGTLPGRLVGADACVNEGIWLCGGSGTKSPGGPGSYREASAGLGRGAEHDGIVRQGSLLWQKGWWHHLGGGVRTAGWRGGSCVNLGIGLCGDRNQIARGAGLLQGSSRQPGQRRCRSPALRAIGLRGRTVSRGVWQQGMVLFFGRRNGPVQQPKRLAAEGIPAHPWPPWSGRGRAAGFFFKKRAKGSDRRFR